MSKQSILAKILGLPEGVKVTNTFNPLDNSIMKITWKSPNDKKENLVNMLLNPLDFSTMRIKDNH